MLGLEPVSLTTSTIINIFNICSNRVDASHFELIIIKKINKNLANFGTFWLTINFLLINFLFTSASIQLIYCLLWLLLFIHSWMSLSGFCKSRYSSVYCLHQLTLLCLLLVESGRRRLVPRHQSLHHHSNDLLSSLSCSQTLATEPQKQCICVVGSFMLLRTI